MSEFVILTINKAKDEDRDVKYDVDDSFQHLKDTHHHICQEDRGWKARGFNNEELIYAAHQMCLMSLCCKECRERRRREKKKKKKKEKSYFEFDDSLFEELSTSFI